MIHAPRGLDRLVDGWVISDQLGIRKPDPRIFEALAGRLRTPLSGWMVGDGLEADIAGGAACGLSTAYITKNPTPPRPSDPVPDITVPDVATAVATILERVNS